MYWDLFSNHDQIIGKNNEKKYHQSYCFSKTGPHYVIAIPSLCHTLPLYWLKALPMT